MEWDTYKKAAIWPLPSYAPASSGGSGSSTSDLSGEEVEEEILDEEEDFGGEEDAAGDEDGPADGDEPEEGSDLDV